MAPYIPNTADVKHVRVTLASRRLPNELILEILDQATYWVERTHEVQGHKVLLDEEYSLDFSAVYPYFGCPAFPTHHQEDNEIPRFRKVELTVVSHDQGWTTENTSGTFETSSWFDVSILRQHGGRPVPPHILAHAFVREKSIQSNIYRAQKALLGALNVQLVPRPSSETELQRLHCPEMNITDGNDAWYLQGNEVARATSVFDGEMIRRYRVVWGCKAHPAWVGNEGTGKGDGFVDSLKPRDWICVWAHAKRRGWENHVHGIRMTISTTI